MGIVCHFQLHTRHFWFLRFNSKNKISICDGREYLFSRKTMILSRTYNKMTLLFWSSLWGTEKPFIKNSIYGKVLSNLVSGNIKISTYCATDLDSIPNLLWVEFTFKWRIIERPVHSTLGRQDALGMRLYIQQYIWIFYRSSWVRLHSIFFLFFPYRFSFA